MMDETNDPVGAEHRGLPDHTVHLGPLPEGKRTLITGITTCQTNARDRLSGKTVLVTGASGFVGSHVLAGLAQAGARTRALVRPGRLAPGAAELATWDGFGDLHALRRAVEGVDTVVHLAARVHVVRETATNPLEAFRSANVKGTRQLLEAMTNAGVDDLVFMSSIAAVGSRSGGRLHDDASEEPDTPYGRSKLEAERVVAEFTGKRRGARSIVLRPPGIYGPGMRGRLDQLFRLILRGVPIPAVPGVRRSFLYVENLAAAVIHLLEVVPPGLTQHLVAEEPAMETWEFVRLAGRALGRPARLVPVPRSMLRCAGHIGDWINRVATFPLDAAAVDRLTTGLEVETKGLAMTGFVPPFTTAEGVGRTAAWYRALGAGEHCR